MVRGSNGVPFYVNFDLVKMIKPSRDPEASRLILHTHDGSEESISVLGRPSSLASLANGEDDDGPDRVTG